MRIAHFDWTRNEQKMNAQKYKNMMTEKNRMKNVFKKPPTFQQGA